jgi:hypothetical protein
LRVHMEAKELFDVRVREGSRADDVALRWASVGDVRVPPMMRRTRSRRVLIMRFEWQA